MANKHITLKDDFFTFFVSSCTSQKSISPSSFLLWNYQKARPFIDAKFVYLSIWNGWIFNYFYRIRWLLTFFKFGYDMTVHKKKKPEIKKLNQGLQSNSVITNSTGLSEILTSVWSPYTLRKFRFAHLLRSLCSL